MKGILSKSDGTKKGGGQLKALGTQMGYLFGWMLNLMTRLFFGQFWRTEVISTPLPIYHLRYFRVL